MNNLSIVGRLVKDPVIVNKDESRYAAFSVALNDYAGKDRDPITTYVSCYLWNHGSMDYLKKGQLVSIEGRLSNKPIKILNDNGEEVNYNSLVVNIKSISILSKIENNEESSTNNNPIKISNNKRKEQPKKINLKPKKKTIPSFKNINL